LNTTYNINIRRHIAEIKVWKALKHTRHIPYDM
jgi:hypothetical protein